MKKKGKLSLYYRKNTISLKGRIKKVSKNINYNELFTSIEDIKPIDKKENLASNDNVLDLYTNLGFTENRNNNKLSDENRKPSANNPLPRSKDDLLFFDECHEKQEIDDNFEFLKDLKKDLIPQKVEQTKPIIEETSESDKIINRLRNNGSFSLTEISKFRKDSKQGMIN